MCTWVIESSRTQLGKGAMLPLDAACAVLQQARAQAVMVEPAGRVALMSSGSK